MLFELSDLRRELADIENAQSNIFDQTAENRAKNQTIMWWVLRLSHWKEFGHKDTEEFFGKGNYEEKLEKYDDYEEDEDEFLGEAIRKLAYFVSFWYMGRATSQEEFKAVEDLYDTENKSPEEAAEEELEAVKEEVAETKEAKKPKAAKKKRGRQPKAKKTTPTEEKAEEPVEETSEQEKPALAKAEASAETETKEEKKLESEAETGLKGE